jgi:hypothetical protein
VTRKTVIREDKQTTTKERKEHHIPSLQKTFKEYHCKLKLSVLLINSNIPAVIKIWQQCPAFDEALQKNWSTARN